VTPYKNKLIFLLLIHYRLGGSRGRNNWASCPFGWQNQLDSPTKRS